MGTVSAICTVCKMRGAICLLLLRLFFMKLQQEGVSEDARLNQHYVVLLSLRDFRLEKLPVP